MAHARITLDYAVELITARIENGQGSPTDAEVAAYCGMDEPVHVRSLLADLADAGRITIRGTGADRQITLGRTARAPLVPAMPSTALARKANREVDAAVKRIGDIVRRKPTELAAEVAAEALETSGRRVAAARSGTTIRPGDKAKPQPSKRRLTLDETAARVQSILARSSVTPKPVSPPAIPPGDGGEGVQERGSRRDDPAPQPIHLEPLPPEVVAQLSQPGQREARGEPAPVAKAARRVLDKAKAPKLEMVRLPTKGCRGKHKRLDAIAPDRSRKQINLHLSIETYAEIARRSAVAGQHPGGYARTLLLGALAGNAAPPATKVHIPAHITAAAISEGVPVVAFVADMLERGFLDWRGSSWIERYA